MNRRKAIKHMGLGISAGLVLPSLLNACVDDENAPEINYNGVVGIIGAGAAGLIAADILISKGVNVKIFEANNRVGGRICSLYRTSSPSDSLIFFPGNYPYSDFPIELGPDRINGSDSKWANILAVRGVPVVNFRNQSSDRYVVGNAINTEAEAMTNSGFAAAKSFFNSFTAFSGPPALSVEQAALGAGVPASQLALINSWLGNPYGSSAANIGARALAEGLALVEHNGTELTLRNNPMQDVLLSVYSRVVPAIRFNTVVQAVHYGGDVIEVIHNGGSETVNKLIVTVPISIIKEGDITFSPSLPAAKLAALSRLGMDPAMRIVLEFKRNFYGEDVAAIFGSTESPVILNAAVGRSNLNKTLSITVFGLKANAYSAMEPDDVVMNILAEMDTWYGGDATENIRRSTIPEDNNRLLYTIKDWKKDPYAKGGISYHLPGGALTDREVLSAPVGGKLFFAGEATDFTGEAGTVSGALKSGERAAFEVIDAILNG
ncbi:MAG: FAD-dependent oxidoreductase [Cyclobacteriaceae bacterium]|nr:FAD-dependent oxidoreductase [Cyclobacteriaceae bacterium]MDW8330617.1 NAD(P)/FAD-dependent oxidoreductase [Cyclobacteriaceae bacterium]